MLTKQEIFDKVSSHLLKQMQRSTSRETMLNGNGCAYHGDDGLKCAVGVLILDSVYNASYEVKKIETLFDMYEPEMAQCGLNSDHITLLKMLQSVHDNHSPYDWTRVLRNIARTYNLKFQYGE